ncbi:MAG: hypothetical protein IJU35_00940 [Paludibacteraceae bacterium]|nr:hypothetical protein [Paludibacteraceae bacterium]
MKLTPEIILQPRPVQVTLLSLITAGLAAFLFAAMPWQWAVGNGVLFTVVSLLVSLMLYRTKQTRMFEFTPAIVTLFTILAAGGAARVSRFLFDGSGELQLSEVMNLSLDVLVLLTLLIVLLVAQPIWKVDNPAREMFLITILLTLASYCCPPLLLLIPVIWIIFIGLQSFGFRTWLASLFGVASVALIAAAVLYALNQLRLPDIYHFGMPFITLSLIVHTHEFIKVIVLGILIICNIVYQSLNGYRDDQYSRVLMNSWSFFAIALVVLYLAYPVNRLLLAASVMTMLLIFHSTSMRKSWFVVAQWVIYFVAALL